MSEDWLSTLETTARRNRLVVFQFEGEECSRLRDSRWGMSEFTVARAHDTVKMAQAPTACVLLGNDETESEVRFGVMSSRRAVSTLESRLKVRRAQRIQPSSKFELLRLVREGAHAAILRTRLSSNDSVIVLPSETGAELIRKIAELESNRAVMRMVAASLSSSRHYGDMAAIQEDAVETALRAFGLAADDHAVSIELVKGQASALTRFNVVEDAVIEHDARYVSGYELVGSDFTGRAVFERGAERLEIYTANRRPLERVFGVDLIYLNLTRQNIVMLQYKMLERGNQRGLENEWIYRPDANLESEIKRMQRFRKKQSPGRFEYRLNPEVFYLKFVKRDSARNKASITMPIGHYEKLREDPSCQGPRGGFRIDFGSLAGRYLRQTAFLDLIRSGYIGAHAETTEHLKNLIGAVARGDKAVVAAIQSVSGISDDGIGELDSL